MAANKMVNGITSQAAEAKKRMTKEDDEGYGDFLSLSILRAKFAKFIRENNFKFICGDARRGMKFPGCKTWVFPLCFSVCLIFCDCVLWLYGSYTFIYVFESCLKCMSRPCVSLVAKLPFLLFLFHSKLFVGGLSYETTKGNLMFLL